MKTVCCREPKWEGYDELPFAGNAKDIKNVLAKKLGMGWWGKEGGVVVRGGESDGWWNAMELSHGYWYQTLIFAKSASAAQLPARLDIN